MAGNEANGGHAAKECVAEEGGLAADNSRGGRSRPFILVAIETCRVFAWVVYTTHRRRDSVIESDGLPLITGR